MYSLKKIIKSIGLKEIKLLETVSGKSGDCVLYQKTVRTEGEAHPGSTLAHGC